ncbi:hypothetical protein [Romboutsia lituseburensis]|uniref:Uncharacterized protein n=1 Tax=Romboutsia lituseburensis DSM 797 TaxID=1121325 RepID=A0A1G9M9U1_9FIRM|nr:hypothetical protein [Romboutsia lituseburensis]CEH34552.1 Hypothetical protein RLITU_1968 [Romboutsia lituseburensis]SDL70894.1 hypothetical protein SAMN04515677_103132 [Romboutsia lituseburensis DSM 797]
MKRIDIASKTITLLTALSVVYAALESNILFIAPIITLAIPYTFMKEKGLEHYSQNKRILNNLFLFNILSFMIVSMISNHMNQTVFDIVVNMVVSYAYFKVIWAIENKQIKVYKNPELLCEKLEDKIQVLEAMKEKLENDMESIDNEKAKTSLETKLMALNQKILQDKSQLEIIKMKIETQKDDVK